MDIYLIVNMSKTREHRRSWWQLWIPPEARPSCIYYVKEQAENEIVRLKKMVPEDDFVLYKGIAEMVMKQNYDCSQVAFTLE